MTYTKRIVCLANSRKFSGRCVAGVELLEGQLGEWIRPVSGRASEELSLEERRYADGRDVQLLDVVDITFLQPRPHACQTENHVIDDTIDWVRVGTLSANRLLRMARRSGPLWVDRYSSYSGRNDRIPVQQADELESSLLLVASSMVSVSVGPGFKKRQVRAAFALAGGDYSFGVTDARVEAEFLAKGDGDYQLPGTTLLCVSLGEAFEGFRYKLAASLIRDV